MKIFLLLFLSISSLMHADYVMMCTFFDDPVSRIYNVSDSGKIIFDHTLEVGGYPLKIDFASNGKWGMVGGDTIPHKPETHIVTILSVDDKKNISVMDTIHNEYYDLVRISPDSRYGVFNNYLHTIMFDDSFTTFTTNTENSKYYSDRYADFSSYNNKLIARWSPLKEYEMNENGRMVETGNTLDISPSGGNSDLEISPDGKTCIVLSIWDYQITVVKLKKEGGLIFVQNFNTQGSNNTQEVVFTPNSKYAIVSFRSGDVANLRSYRIELDSKLEEIDSLLLPSGPGEDLAITPDGKYVVTRALINNYSYFYVTRLYEDGTMEYLPEKDFVDTGHVSAMAFVPPQPTAAGNFWTLY